MYYKTKVSKANDTCVYSWLVMVLSLHLNNVSSLVMNTTTDDTQFKNYNDKTSLMAKIFSRIYFSKQQ